jgi:hypothetical protein
MRLSMTRYALAALAFSTACATTAPEDDPLPSQLDRLRVLAIAADPPDLVPGESATLSALVFTPEDRAVDYAWSWCPVEVEIDTELSCPIDEALWAELWASAGLAGDAPAYDLGSAETAMIQPQFEADSALRLCQAINQLGQRAESARIACVDGFEANVVLRARAGGDEEIAVKSVPFLPDGTPDEARNHNPGPLGEVSVRDLGSGEPLRSGLKYALRVDLDEGSSEAVPDDAEGRETLVLSWFVTTGKVEDPEEDDDDDGGGPFESDTQRTLWVPGQSEFDSLLENGWKLPYTAPRAAELVLVLRDGRGGVAWRRDEFELVGEDR